LTIGTGYHVQLIVHCDGTGNPLDFGQDLTLLLFALDVTVQNDGTVVRADLEIRHNQSNFRILLQPFTDLGHDGGIGVRASGAGITPTYGRR